MTERTLARALECLQPVSESLVVVGGTAHRMFPLHEHGEEPGFALLTTEDVDIAAPLELGHDGSRSLIRRLEAAGFREEVRGADSPTTTYRLPDDGQSYLQFIAPLTGSGIRRDDSRDSVLRFSGIYAEKLRYVDVLLYRPWRATVQVEGVEHTLQVVNPVAYLLQKLLVLPQRRDKRGKDLLYIFDTLSIFGAALDALRAESANLAVRPKPKAAKLIVQTANELCFRESDISRDAENIAAGQRPRPPASAQIVAACKLNLRRVLGDLVPDL
jgi:hypothetical protein